MISCDITEISQISQITEFCDIFRFREFLIRVGFRYLCANRGTGENFVLDDDNFVIAIVTVDIVDGRSGDIRAVRRYPYRQTKNRFFTKENRFFYEGKTIFLRRCFRAKNEFHFSY